jgi:FKBP-type peptidyl-prolyl cis-trans isomerase SlyD
MTIDKDTVVSVSYHLKSKRAGEKEEQTVEITKAGDPFIFLFGSGGLIEGFESNLKGKKVGDKFDFHIAPAEGYGEHHLDNVVNIPVTAFHDEKGKLDHEMVKVGNVLPMTDSDGNQMRGSVQEITGEHVRMDFNHPLAGQDLHFAGEVLEIRDATKEELSHGHVHGPGGHHH